MARHKPDVLMHPRQHALAGGALQAASGSREAPHFLQLLAHCRSGVTA